MPTQKNNPIFIKATNLKDIVNRIKHETIMGGRSLEEITTIILKEKGLEIQKLTGAEDNFIQGERINECLIAFIQATYIIFKNH